MTHFSPIGTLNDRRLSWVDDMMEMIERCAPRMMRVGGSSCGGESLTAGRAMPQETIEQIKVLHFQGYTAEQIGRHTGYHYQTIYRVTRPWRKIRGQRAAA